MGFQDVTKGIRKFLKISILYHWHIQHVSKTMLTIYEWVQKEEERKARWKWSCSDDDEGKPCLRWGKFTEWYPSAWWWAHGWRGQVRCSNVEWQKATREKPGTRASEATVEWREADTEQKETSERTKRGLINPMYSNIPSTQRLANCRAWCVRCGPKRFSRWHTFVVLANVS